MLIFRRPQRDKNKNASICTVLEKLNAQMILYMKHLDMSGSWPSLQN